MKKKTLADLKRDAATGYMWLKCINWNGKTGNEIPAHMQEFRRISRVNSAALYIDTNGQESELSVPRAKLVKYTDSTLTIYYPALRDPTDQEKQCLTEADKLSEKYRYYSGNIEYWYRKDYFSKCSCPWMWGFKRVRGKKYDISSDKVSDESIPGDIALVYQVELRYPDRQQAASWL